MALKFYKIVNLSEVALGSSKVIDFMRKEIAIFRTEAGVFAVDNLCPHRQAPLSTGKVENGVVSCPWHAARFELATGKGLAGAHQKDIGSYPIKVQGDEVLIGVEF